jgi:drug/metabolite transporter (DMT)-like permease
LKAITGADEGTVARDTARRSTAVVAFAALYIIWGSTYAVIRVGVAELPPALFVGVRLVIAGVLMALYARVAGGQRLPWTRREWRIVIVSGLSMLGTANGLVAWSEQWLPSGQAALLVATAALWLAGFGTLGRRGHKLDLRTLAGLAIGFAGTAMLLWPERGFTFQNLGAQLGILFGALSWSAGSIYIKRQQPQTPPLMSAGLQSFTAGVFLSLIGLAAGESSRWVWTVSSLWALAYLILFGSCMGYAAYIWLLHHVRPAALGTYAYVNPAVAVIIGWVFLGEILTPIEAVSMVVILAGVALVTLGGTKQAVTDTAR